MSEVQECIDDNFYYTGDQRADRWRCPVESHTYKGDLVGNVKFRDNTTLSSYEMTQMKDKVLRGGSSMRSLNK